MSYIYNIYIYNVLLKKNAKYGNNIIKNILSVSRHDPRRLYFDVSFQSKNEYNNNIILITKRTLDENRSKTVQTLTRKYYYHTTESFFYCTCKHNIPPVISRASKLYIYTQYRLVKFRINASKSYFRQRFHS